MYHILDVKFNMIIANLSWIESISFRYIDVSVSPPRRNNLTCSLSESSFTKRARPLQAFIKTSGSSPPETFTKTPYYCWNQSPKTANYTVAVLTTPNCYKKIVKVICNIPSFSSFAKRANWPRIWSEAFGPLQINVSCLAAPRLSSVLFFRILYYHKTKSSLPLLSYCPSTDLFQK